MSPVRSALEFPLLQATRLQAARTAWFNVLRADLFGNKGPARFVVVTTLQEASSRVFAAEMDPRSLLAPAMKSIE
jgi:hypothetical protein